MNDYVGKICPYCRKKIKKYDSVMLCPTFGIPHHRTCWDRHKGRTTADALDNVAKMLSRTTKF